MTNTKIDRESVERWECSTCPRTMGPEMVADPLGDWVRHEDFRAALDAAEAENKRLRRAALDATAHLVAATSLLRTGGKKAAPSDKMFEQMLVDYEAAIKRARAALLGTAPINEQSEEENPDG